MEYTITQAKEILNNRLTELGIDKEYILDIITAPGRIVIEVAHYITSNKDASYEQIIHVMYPLAKNGEYDIPEEYDGQDFMDYPQ